MLHSLVSSTLAGSVLPPVVADVFGGFVTAARVMAVLVTLGACALLPLIMPAFVGAAAMQLLFGRSGSVNLILNDAFGFTLPLMEGLHGVIFVETLHYFPFVLLNLAASLATIDTSM